MKQLIFLICLLCFGPASAVGREPAVEIRSLLNARFMPTGVMMFSEFRLFFPPAEPANGAVILKRGEQEISNRPISSRYRNIDEDKVIALVAIEGIPVQKLTEAGDYELSVLISGKVVTRFPFKVTIKKSDDPFNPSSVFTVDGPWQKMAYFKNRKHTHKKTRQVGQALTLTFWPGQADARGDDKVNLHAFVYQNEKIVAQSKMTVGRAIKTSKALPLNSMTELDLYQPHERKGAGTADRFTIDQLKDGQHTVKVKRSNDDAVVREYSFEVKDGEIQQPPQAKLDYQPHSDMLVPRVLKTGTTRNEHEPVHWLIDTRISNAAKSGTGKAKAKAGR